MKEDAYRAALARVIAEGEDRLSRYHGPVEGHDDINVVLDALAAHSSAVDAGAAPWTEYSDAWDDEEPAVEP